MAVVDWSPDLEIGVSEIDQQHRNLVAITNHLHDALLAGQAQQAIEWIIDELTVYVKFHFDAEEKYMKTHGHADTAAHKLEHKEMLKAIRRFRKKFYEGEPRVENEVMSFLSGWLLQHIMGTDRQLGRPPASRSVR